MVRDFGCRTCGSGHAKLAPTSGICSRDRCDLGVGSAFDLSMPLNVEAPAAWSWYPAESTIVETARRGARRDGQYLPGHAHRTGRRPLRPSGYAVAGAAKEATAAAEMHKQLL